MRFLQVIRTLDPRWGGPVEVVKQLSQQAEEGGLLSDTLSVDDPGSPWLASWPESTHAIGKGISTFGYTRRLDEWLAGNIGRYDAVLVHSIWMYFSLAVRHAATKQGVPYYLFIHGALDPWFKKQYFLKQIKKEIYWRLFEHKVLRDAAAVLFTTEDEKRLAQNAFKPYACNPATIGFGISPPPEFSPQTQEALISELASTFPALRGRTILLYLGRIHEKKGADLLIRAYAKLLYRLEGTCLVLAGPGDDPILKSLQSLASELKIGDRIAWPGPLYGNAKWALMRAAEVFVLPSHQENFGISVVEALACGTPVLISDKVNIWREVDRECAGLVGSDDLPGTTNLLERWRNLRHAEKDQMRCNAKRCFSTHFDIARSSSRLFELMAGHRSIPAYLSSESA